MKKTLFILLLLLIARPVFAHEGHNHAAPPGAEGAGLPASIVELSDAAINNLGIVTVKAEITPRADTVSVNGIVEFLPERQAVVTSRAIGRVTEIHAKVGEEVKNGQDLLTIQPAFIGSTPVRVTSPIDGIVAKQNAVIGQTISPSTSLMEVGDSSVVLVRGILYETPDVAKIRIGQSVRVTSGLLGNTVLNGKVQRMDGAFDRGSRTLNVYAVTENPDRLLLVNMQVILSVNVSEPADVLTVPSRAILGEGGDNFVFVRTGNKFERRNVKLGTKFGSDREILEGVFPDEEVVTVGNYQLQFAKPSTPAGKQLKD